MKEIKAIIQPSRLYSVLTALREIPGMPGLTVSEIRGFPRGHADPRSQAHGIDAMDSVEMVKIECVVPDERVSAVVDAITRAAHTGNPGDGKIFVSEVSNTVKIRTGEHGEQAI
jgi:nitrogen regulatory protein P-II 1